MSDESLPPGLRCLSTVAEACRRVMDAPVDLAMAKYAIEGLALAVESLEAQFRGAASVARRIRASYVHVETSVAAGATILAFSRRKSKHLLYILAVDLGRAAEAGHPLDPIALEIVGSHFLLRLFQDRQPSPTSIAKFGAILLRPSSMAAKRWPLPARVRSHRSAMDALAKAIAASPAVAASFGLSDLRPRRGTVASSPIALFNRAYRRRMRDLRVFASLHDKAGTGGNGTLPAEALRSAGQELMAGVRLGDAGAAHVCIECISRLSSELVDQLPLQLGAYAPDGPLAWLDISGGAFCRVLYDLEFKGARPPAGTAHLYEATERIVRVVLPPPLSAYLQKVAASASSPPTTAGKLLGEAGHDPRAEVASTGAYRITARRLQESLPPQLLDQGFHRWPIALATSSHFLVPQGREFYGSCRATDVHAVLAAMYAALGWPAPADMGAQGLLGSRVTPKPASVTMLLNHLAFQADLCCDMSSLAGIQQTVNSHAAWIAALWALAFALREWERYALAGDQLRSGRGVAFDEKGLHSARGGMQPVPSLVRTTLLAWDALMAQVVLRLRELGGAVELELAAAIERYTADPRQTPPAFAIDAALELHPVGHRSWHTGLPKHIRTVINFARHFWPMPLMAQGLPQLLIDVLMRHQIEGLHCGSSNITSIRSTEHARLASALEQVMADLSLEVPQLLRSQP